jgi:DNA-binding transcriptional ArsR family regulator
MQIYEYPQKGEKIMPLQVDDFTEQKGVIAEQVVFLEPVYNLLYSLTLLIKEKSMPGLADWVLRIKDTMSLAERQRHRLVMNGLGFSFVPNTGWQSFAGYLDHLATLKPESFQDRLLHMYSSCSCGGSDKSGLNAKATPNKAEILASADSYLAFLEECFDPAALDYDLEAQAYRYVIDPPAMQALIVDHLRSMWDEYLAAEWAKVRPMLREAVNAFRQIDLKNKPRQEIVRFIVGQEPPSQHWIELIDTAKRLVLVPNAHIGPYMGKYVTPDTLYIMFGARLPEGSRIDAPDLSRGEILSSLGALADDNRLRILRLAADAGKLRTATVMESLDLSQSAVSRHLTQLTATGYLRERRCEAGKCYTLRPERVGDTFRALSGFLSLPGGNVVDTTGNK